MKAHAHCYGCKKAFSIEKLPLTCDCGGMLVLKRPQGLSPDDFVVDEYWSLFRYHRFLPKNILKGIEVSQGEGMTPLIPYGPRFKKLSVKQDYFMPTLSFKDRGASVLMAYAKGLGVKEIVQDSSGNAGTSVASYAARASMRCSIFVPANCSKNKLKQIYDHGAHVVEVRGSREDTANAALEYVEKNNLFYASHVYNPFFHEGTKTYVFELFEQMGGKLPDFLWVPVGNGTLLLGCYYGLLDLKAAGMIKKFPKLIAVQSQNCAPIYEAYLNGLNDVVPVENTGTLAEGIAIADPKRGKLILDALRSIESEIIVAPEKEILNAKSTLALDGHYVETTTAATFAAYFKYAGNYHGHSVISACGAGLKSTK
jgi:threonine synthase